MPIPEQRDLEAARGILAGWLAKTSASTGSRSARSRVPRLTGFSNETLLFDATYTKPRARASPKGSSCG